MAVAAGEDAELRPRPDVFVSYSRRDGERVLRLVEALRAKNVTVWMDQGGIEAAARWSQEIVEAITGAKLFLFVASAKSFESENVAKELSIASEEKKPILPVYLEPVSVPASIRYQLAGIQHLELYGPNEARAFESILRALRKHGVAASGSAPARHLPLPRSKSALIVAAGVLVLAAILGVGSVYAWPSRSPSLQVALPATLSEMGGASVRLYRTSATGEELVAETRLGRDQVSVLFRGKGFDEDALRLWLEARGAPEDALRRVAIGDEIRVRDGEKLRAELVRLAGEPPAPVLDATARTPLVIASVVLEVTAEGFQTVTLEDKTR